ncbi:FkbM family methyltransferase [Candidatus Pelagibacter ubique]|nr:FkbM family methyltransferase [Candidatus Pelagibacter ubique]
MIISKQIYIFLYFIIDKFFHQKRISSYFKKNLKINLFFDIGCHLGNYSDIIISNYPKAVVYMFEPQKKIFDKIKIKYEKNLNVYIYNLAISNKKSYQNLYINKFDVASTLSKINLQDELLKKRARYFGEDPSKMIEEIQNIETIKLDEFINEKKIKNIDLIKIDTEGHEFEVLDGLRENIQKIKFILIEFQSNKIFDSYDSEKIDKYLKANKFELIKSFKFPLRPWEDRLYKKI